jgi:hypothetical protein
MSNQGFVRRCIRIITRFAALFTLVAAAGCNSNKSKPAILDISLKNCSSNALDWVELKWAGPYVPGGILSPGISSTAVGVQWPNVPSGTIHFVDERTRKPYNIDVSFSIVNERLQSEKHHDVTIRILNYEKADAVCESPY